MLNWLDQRLLFRRRSRAPFEGTALDVTDGFADDPIVAVEAGHPAVELGFEFLLRDILQIATPPPDEAEWAERLLVPPTPDDLRRTLEPHRRAFVLDHPEFPAFQVRPVPERLYELSNKRSPNNTEVVSIATLLPDQPTKEAAGKQDFFQRNGVVDSISTALILPIFYYHMVMFPSGGGGYYGLGRGLGFGSAIKYFLVAETLWERVWLNVLASDDAFFGAAVWPAPCSRLVYPWLDERLRYLALGQVKPAEARRLAERGMPIPRTTLEVSVKDLHPAAIPMPRRYLLHEARNTVCGLTGRHTLCFTSYIRWQQGPDYSPEGWRWWGVAERRTLVREGSGVTLKVRKFPGTRGPLRFDDWLHVALGGDQPPPSEKARAIEQVIAPPAILALRARREHLVRAWRRHHQAPAIGGINVLAAGRGTKSPYRVRAVVQFPFGNAVGGTSTRELPLYDLPGTAARELAIAAAQLAERIAKMAEGLGKAARKAISDLHRKLGNEIAAQLEDDLLAAMDRPVIDAITRLAEQLAEGNADDTTIDVELREQARRTALALFDAAFPIIGGDAPSVKIAEARRELVHDLRRLAPRPHTARETREAVS